MRTLMFTSTFLPLAALAAAAPTATQVPPAPPVSQDPPRPAAIPAPVIRPAAPDAAPPAPAPAATPSNAAPAPAPAATRVFAPPPATPNPAYTVKPLPGFTWDLYAQEPLVEDPVAFSIDGQGNLFVAESFRQEVGVEDNRSSSFWLEDDLQLQSVEDRLRMYEKWAHKREGGMDYYRREEDRVVKLVDTDGDGKPDTKILFSGPMNEPLDGTGAGVMCLNGDVWFTCIPHLWRLRDTTGSGVADVREQLFSGFGIRTALRGHDMHGLVEGPDGRIYWSIGDRGYRVTTREGRTLANPFTGAVFRCEPDGRGLEVFAYSLRNPQELAFNQWGDLFTGDNNSDGGDKARIVYVMEGSETGWDMHYQTMEGQNQRGPWNQERTWWLWDPNDPIRPAWTLPPIDHQTAGPSGMTFYPGVGLPERYADHFFLCDFLGGDEYSSILSFAVEPEGAGYKVVDAHPFVNSVLATDVDFGYDGRMYISDWSNGWVSDHTGQIFRVWHPEHVNDPQVQEVTALFREGFSGLTNDRLLALLAHPDIRVRQRAHLELAQRGAQTTEALAQLAQDQEARVTPRLHALWALGVHARRAGAQANPKAPETIQNMLQDPHVELRRLAARLAGDVRLAEAAETLIELLTDESPRVRAEAAMALGKLEHKEAFANLAALIWENENQDPYLRHAAVMGLMGTAGADNVRELAADPFVQNRLAAVLVMRRMHDPQLARLLHDPDLRVATEAARAVNDLPIAEAQAALAAVDLEARAPQAAEGGAPPTTGTGTSGAAATADPLMPLARRVINANLREGTPANAAVLAQIARSDALDPAIRAEAMAALAEFMQPAPRDRVNGHWRPVDASTRDREGFVEVLRQRLPSLVANGTPDVRTVARELAGRFQVPLDNSAALATVLDSAKPVAERTGCLTQLAQDDDERLPQALQAALSDDAVPLRIRARSLLAQRDPAGALPLLQGALSEGTLPEQQAAIADLAGITLPQAQELLRAQAQRLQEGTLPPALVVDVIEAAQADPVCRQAVEAWRAGLPADTPNAEWLICAQGGDAERGRQLVHYHSAAACLRCHTVEGTGGHAAPGLAGVGARLDRAALVRSLVDPNADVAEGFGPISAMPKMDTMLTPRQVRDIVEYLSTLK